MLSFFCREFLGNQRHFLRHQFVVRDVLAGIDELAPNQIDDGRLHLIQLLLAERRRFNADADRQIFDDERSGLDFVVDPAHFVIGRPARFFGRTRSRAFRRLVAGNIGFARADDAARSRTALSGDRPRSFLLADNDAVVVVVFERPHKVFFRASPVEIEAARHADDDVVRPDDPAEELLNVALQIRFVFALNFELLVDRSDRSACPGQLLRRKQLACRTGDRNVFDGQLRHGRPDQIEIAVHFFLRRTVAGLEIDANRG
ncbi:hypothetical protein PACILC2_38610 [Paenibacillus cisolokensis]|uniref:Uncharacterized protein n=1 Tax=Paenibacillus cisolokensis TaxID=1658519 RepID=A0ABQ4NAP8_9BACL|nr:hypothetical protein PACILC2_38610 [Paenibacillus cisolokensis]